MIIKSVLSYNELVELKLDHSNLLNGYNDEILKEITEILSSLNENMKISIQKSNINPSLVYNLNKFRIINL